LIGEKHIRPNSRDGKNEDRSVFGVNANNYTRNAGLWIESDGTQHTYSLVASESDQSSIDANSRFGGPHSGVCMFVFVDGSVRALRNELPPGTITGTTLNPGVLH